MYGAPVATTRAAASESLRGSCSVERPAADTSTSRSTRVPDSSASSPPMNPPIELPTTLTRSTPSASHIASTVRA